jgi:cytidine deaminase
MAPDQLIAAAKKVRQQAYVPYSKFAVGAALLTAQGEIFSGCNVENISFGLTICAERAAVFSAIAAGHREFRQIVVVSDSEEAVSPCGACRQVLAEFAPNLKITTLNLRGAVFESSLETLLPRAKTGILDAPRST